MSLALDAGPAFAVPLLKNQFVIGLLDERAEESALDFKAGLMDKRLDLVGEMLILMRHGQGHLERQFEGECLVSPVDGAASDGSLEAVGLAHGESPYCNYGGSSCVFSPVCLPKSLPEFRSSWCHSSLSYAISLRSRTN